VSWAKYELATQSKSVVATEEKLGHRADDLDIALGSDGKTLVVAAGKQLWYLDTLSETPPAPVAETAGGVRPHLSAKDRFVFFESDAVIGAPDQGTHWDAWARDRDTNFSNQYDEAEAAGTYLAIARWDRMGTIALTKEQIGLPTAAATRLVAASTERGFFLVESHGAHIRHWPACGCSCGQAGEEKTYPCGQDDPEICGMGTCEAKPSPHCATCGECSGVGPTDTTRKLYLGWMQAAGPGQGPRLATGATNGCMNDGECTGGAFEPGGEKFYVLCNSSTLHEKSPDDGSARLYRLRNGHI
jgi:hypothetical protein